MPVACWIEVDEEKCELDVPFECPECHGHVRLDITFYDQVQKWCFCPYCLAELQWPDGDWEEDE